MKQAPLLTLVAVVAVCGSFYLFGETTSPRDLTDRGYAALGRSDFGGAADELERAVKGLEKDDPELQRATVGLVRALSHFNAPEARDRFFTFAAAHPEDAPAGLYMSISDEMFVAGAKVEAIQVLHAGIERYDERSDLTDQMSRFLAESKRNKNPEAVEALASLGYLGR